MAAQRHRPARCGKNPFCCKLQVNATTGVVSDPLMSRTRFLADTSRANALMHGWPQSYLNPPVSRCWQLVTSGILRPHRKTYRSISLCRQQLRRRGLFRQLPDDISLVSSATPSSISCASAKRTMHMRVQLRQSKQNASAAGHPDC